ncbi:MAG: hypothetical protein HY319_07135, partial [Armatimonadetes bacterium]|nr:hypothetical protein [Armatimonadota bacterium]
MAPYTWLPQLAASPRRAASAEDRAQLATVEPRLLSEADVRRTARSPSSPRVDASQSLAPATALAAVNSPAAAAAGAVAYPPSRIEPVQDNYHGHELTDNYRWLENGESADVKEWVRQQNELTTSQLSSIPFRDQLKERLTELLTIDSVGSPFFHGDKTFQFRRTGEQNQAVLYVKDAAGNERVALDPNSWSEQGIESLDWDYISPNAHYIAYGRSTGGDEWSTLHVLDLETGQELEEQIPRTRAASLAWLPDESGFYYTRYPAPGEVPPGDENYHRSVYFHQLGSDPAGDQRIYSDENKQAWPNLQISDDGKKLLIAASQGWTREDLYVLDRETGELKPMLKGVEAKFATSFVDGQLYAMTDHNAPQKRLVRIDPARPEPENWAEVIPQRDDAVLESYEIVNGQIFATYLKDASSQVVRYDTQGNRLGELQLPGIGTVGGIVPGPEKKELYYSFSSYNRPPTVYRYDIDSGETSVWSSVDVGVDPDDFEVKQQWYTSFDGTQVPMFIVHKKGVELDGDNPTVLYGYGGFDVSMTPSFSKSTLQWLESGGV